MTVENQIPYQTYTANGTDSSFALGFYVEDKANFIVKQNGVVIPTNDYSYNSLTNTLKFNVAPSTGVIVEVTRATSADRATTYATYNNTFRPEVLNKDIDRIWLKIQELGVADVLLKIYTDKLHLEQKDYIDNEDQIIKNIISDLRNYVNQQDNSLTGEIGNLRTYVNQQDNVLIQSISNLKNYVDQQDNNQNNELTDLINKQGVSLNQLKYYYDSLMQAIATIATNKGWEASFVVDHETGETVKQTIDKSITTVESIEDLLAKNNPKDGQAITVKSYHEGLKVGGGLFIYDNEKSTINDGVVTFNGWVRQDITTIYPEYAGAKGTGNDDDSLAFQTALNYLGNGGVLQLNAKEYLINTPLIFNAAKYWQKIKGTAYTDGAGTGGINSSLVFKNIGAAVAITTGNKSYFENVCLIGSGINSGATALKSGGTVKDINTKNVIFINWGVGIELNTAYYSRIYETTFRFVLTGMKVDYCFNLSLKDCYFNGGTPQIRGEGVHVGLLLTNRPSQVHITGGTFENYWGALSYAIFIDATGSTLSVDSTYFEPYGSKIEETTQAAIKVSVSKAMVTVANCFVYCYYQNYFVDLSTAQNIVFNAHGNHFTHGGMEGEPIGIYHLPNLTTLWSSQIDIYGDDAANINPTRFNNVTYITPKENGIPLLENCRIVPLTYGVNDIDRTHIYNGRYSVSKPLKAAPSSPKKGVIYWADGITWKPVYSEFLPYPVIYNGTDYVPIFQPKRLTTALTNLTLAANQNALAVTSSTAITITLSASPVDGTVHTVKIAGGVNNCIVNGNGISIEDKGASITLTGGTFQSITFQYVSYINRWVMISKI